MKLSFLLTLGLAAAAQASITFNLNFVNGTSTWDSTRQAVVTQAANEWGNLFVDHYTIDVDVTFASAGTGGFLGQWSGARSFFIGDDIKPWQNTTHTIRFNSDLLSTSLDNYLWWDPNLGDNMDQPFKAWDALTVARHEFGHLIGFTDNFYVDNINTASEIDFWANQLSGPSGAKIFDAGGLNVPLYSDDTHTLDLDTGTLADNDLMNPTLANSIRLPISSLNIQMLEQAYGYDLIPEPSALSLIFGGFTLGLMARRRARRNTRH